MFTHSLTRPLTYALLLLYFSAGSIKANYTVILKADEVLRYKDDIIGFMRTVVNDRLKEANITVGNETIRVDNSKMSEQLDNESKVDVNVTTQRLGVFRLIHLLYVLTIDLHHMNWPNNRGN